MAEVPHTPEDINMDAQSQQPSHALVTTPPTQPDQQDLPNTVITEVTSSASLDQPPTTQVAQTLSKIPQLDFRGAIAALPKKFQLSQLELNTTSAQLFAHKFAEHLKKKAGITEERY